VILNLIMLIILAENQEKMTITLSAYLEPYSKEWFQTCQLLGYNKFDLAIEKMFRYAEHYFYKKYLAKKHSIPNWRKLPNDVRKQVEILGELLYCFYRMSIGINGVFNGLIAYKLVRDEFKKDYFVYSQPKKLEFINKYKHHRSALRKMENPFNKTTVWLYELIEDVIDYSEYDRTFQTTVFYVFIDTYKKWCESISICTDWYIKAPF
jgi:hypothetical protein